MGNIPKPRSLLLSFPTVSVGLDLVEPIKNFATSTDVIGEFIRISEVQNTKDPCIYCLVRDQKNPGYSKVKKEWTIYNKPSKEEIVEELSNGSTILFEKNNTECSMRQINTCEKTVYACSINFDEFHPVLYGGQLNSVALQIFSGCRKLCGSHCQSECIFKDDLQVIQSLHYPFTQARFTCHKCLWYRTKGKRISGCVSFGCNC